MDSYEENNVHPNMNNAITKIITNKPMKYDLNIFANVNIREKCQDSVALKEGTSPGVCDNIPSKIVKKKPRASSKKAKSNKENSKNDARVQDTTKIPRRKLKKSSVSAATGKIVKRAIEFKSPQSPYISLHVSKDMCQRQLERLRKQNLSQMVLTQDEIYKLYTKYKLDGHFQVQSSNPPLNSTNKGKKATNKFCDTYNTNSVFEQYAQKNNMEFNERNMYSSATINEDTSKYVQCKDKDLYHGSNTTLRNLHFVEQSMLSFPHQGNSLDGGVCTANFHTSMQQNGNMFNMTSTENTYLDYNATHYSCNNPDMHALNNAWDVGNEIQQYKNHNEELLNNLYDVNRVPSTLNMMLDTEMNDSYKNGNISVTPGSIQNIANHSLTNESTECTLGQNSINSNLMIPSMASLNPVSMGTHNIHSLSMNAETTFNNSVVKNSFMNENEFHNGSNSYSMSNGITNMTSPIKGSSTYELSLLHNENFDYSLGNHYNNNNISNNYNVSTVSWQHDNTLSNAEQISEVTFSALSNTINMSSIGEQCVMEYNTNGATSQCDNTVNKS